MTALDKQALKSLRAIEPRWCASCVNWTCANYCMDCDEYFTAGHSRGCRELSEHAAHRSY